MKKMMIFFYELEDISTWTNNEKKDNEIIYYIRLKPTRDKNDPLEWWLKNKNRLPILA